MASTSVFGPAAEGCRRHYKRRTFPFVARRRDPHSIETALSIFMHELAMSSVSLDRIHRSDGIVQP